MSGRVVLAMSGGVDSSVSAILLREQGYDVVGLFMRTGVETPADGRSDRKKGCCSAVDASDARRVADRLDIPFYALDFARGFGRVIDYFADEYLAGRTPNPCVVCNSWLKFGQLWDYARQVEADFIATGHYARQLTGPDGGAELHRAIDPDKDQSYVLFGITRELLPRLLFPVGGLRKEEVRALARQAGLAVADKPDSVEICFVPDGDHAALIRERRPGASLAGRIVDTAGRELGRHEGIERFTVGQRKGLGVAAGERRYVLRLVPESGDVVVGERDGLQSGGLRASRVNWLTPLPSDNLTCTAKIRYRHPGCPATVRMTSPESGQGAPGDAEAGVQGEVMVTFASPQLSVTPGQAVVFYDGTRVLGGGWIEAALP